MSLLPVGIGAFDSGYTIDQSLRLRNSAPAMFRRTPSSAGNRRTWTLSWWAKRSKLGNAGFTVFSAGTGTSGDTGELVIKYDNNNPDSLAIQTTNTNIRFTNALYRDPSAWHHVVVAFDTTQATAANRHKVYVNGEQVTSFNISNNLAQNTDTAVNNTVQQAWGYFGRINSQYFDGYLTEMYIIDGQQLTADDFGEFDNNTGVWKPKAYSGTYGTNGAYLNGTGTTYIEDVSGNNNDFANVNLQLTDSTASTYDSMADVPTLTNADTANFATLNPVDSYESGLSNGNLTFTNGSGAAYKGISTFVIEDIADSQEYYLEYTSDVGYLSGIVTTSNSGSASNGSYSDIRGYYSNGNKYTGTSASSYGGAFTSTDKLAMLIGDGKLEFFKNNVSQGVAFTGLTGSWKVATVAFGAAGVGVSYNFGQRPFAYTPPTGSKKLNTFNLPDSTIEKGSDYFNTVLYSGNSSTQSITGVGFQPDLVWAKDRTNVVHHTWNDAVRGVNLDLFSSSTSVESNDHAGLTAFNADGFSLGSSTNHNVTGHTYVGWNWKANGSGSSNTDGSITSTVSANTTAGFSIVSYTGNGTSGATIGHGLSSAPKMIIVKIVQRRVQIGLFIMRTQEIQVQRI